MRFPILGVGLMLLASAAAANDLPELTVMTYDSFVADWGPGPAVEEAFEKTCECDLKFVSAGDGAALLARIRLEGTRSETDVVLGLDTNLTAEAASTGLFAPHGLGVPEFDLPVAWDDDTFLPYDWGYFAFVHETALQPAPGSLRDLADSDLQVVIQDPRSSTPGLGLLLWAKAAFGDDAPAFWSDMADNIVTVTPGWSEAYGMFLEGEADMVLSYTTSPAYHLIAEGDDSKKAASFAEGHYMQIEVAGKLAATDQPELADRFLRFMMSDGFQNIIPTTNWMYPAVVPETGLPEGYETLIEPKASLLFSAKEAQSLRGAALDEWLTALSQ
ncbi:MAG: thiamine ABC transporter substrate binding subunit [Silicimonas sp.]|nr:thiamine ABC transporter substrate binding subunit [Silicimonas sp.]